MSSPVLWGPNNTANNLQNQELLATGALLAWNGPKNYITQSSFENGTILPWTTGTTGTLTNGIPTGTPTFGSGATFIANLATTSPAPLSGTGSLETVVSTGVSVVGDMIHTTAYSIDPEDKAKVLTFKFYYSATSGSTSLNFSGTSANSFGVAVYDVTNSVWLPVVGNFAMTQGSGVGIATGTVQTGSTTSSVRFCVYNVNASTSTFIMYYDDFFLGPQTAPIGAPLTDWVAYTPTLSSFGTTTGVSFFSRRDGPDLLILGKWTSGTVTSGEPRISLPAGLTTNASLLDISVGGTWAARAASTQVTTVLVQPNVTYLSFGGSSTSGAPGNFVTNASNIFSNGVTQELECRVPIQGWSSNVQMSNDTDTRVIASSAHATGTAVTGGNPINFDTVDFDLSGSITTGASWKYTAAVTGSYLVEASIAAGTSNPQLEVFKNGSIYRGLFVCTGSAASNQQSSGSTLVQLNAGDFIDIRSSGSITLTTSGGTGATVATSNYVSVFRLSGPAVIAATESVNMRAFSSSTTVSGTLATVVYTTKSFDSHNAYSTSTGIYTAPVSGKYQVNASIAMTGTFILNSTLDLQVQQTGSASQISEAKDFSGGATTQMNTNVGDMFYLQAGDVLKVQVSNSGTAPAIAATTTQNWFSISRVGN